MNHGRESDWSRREFLLKLGLLGSAIGFGLQTEAAGAEPPPETKRIRMTDEAYACLTPSFLAQEFLRGEGFTDVQYVKVGDRIGLDLLVSGEVDLIQDLPVAFLPRVDADAPVVFLAGIHVGCYELFGTERVHSIRDLKGKRVAVLAMGSPEHVFLSTMLAYVGLDPRRDVKWVAHDPAVSMQLLAEGKVDAFLAFAPEPQELRAKKVGHVLVNTATDKPWSQYFCCMAIGNRDFVRRNPVATKRALRALLKSADLCAQDPARAARFMVDKGYSANYQYTFQTLRELPYKAWRTYNPEDTLRFYSLRLHDIGMIKKNPNQLIAGASEWRFLRELKKELKA
jgi:NitT/TauT family transport system substrate-binding protein